MGASIVFNLIKTSLAAIIALLLCVVMCQRDGIEDRLRSVQEGQTDARDGQKDLDREVGRLQKSVGRHCA